jgi:two-component system response regulator NreC
MLTKGDNCATAHPLTKILVVDDVARVRRDLHTLLDLSGEVVVTGEAANGHEAVAQVERLRPDVVLMDLEMPVLDGYEATKHIKANFPECRVIALSVHSYPQARQKASQAGMDGFIEKGTSLAEILHIIQQIWHNGQDIRKEEKGEN